MAPHPVVRPLGFKVVRSARVREDVDEQEAVCLEELGHFFQQQLVVLHVLHHLDRDDAVESAEVFVVNLHGRDVARLDGDVAQAELGSARFDVKFLGGRVRYHEEGTVRQPLCGVYREGAPPAAEVEDAEAGARGDLRPIEIYG